jgi:carnitine 3-dehydrogenase
LTDVVDLDDALVDKIAAQSDAQSGARGIRDLERIRDENLVGIMQALKAGDGGKGWGAGKILTEFEQHLWAKGGGAKAAPDLAAPLRLVDTRVSAAWVDYNGHMTEHRYLQVFGDTSDALLRLIGVDFAYVEAGHSYYTVETHIRHLGEARLGQSLYATLQVLSCDAKRIRFFSTIHDAATGQALATAEQLMLHVDSKAGKSVSAPAEVLARLTPIAEAHAQLPVPNGAGRSVGQR